MRFKITLSLVKNPSFLPFSYQYELSSWIYRVLSNSDSVYAAFLHDTGYQIAQKGFKLFCFSHLYLPKFKIQQKCLQIDTSEISFQISFYMEKGTETFITGLFKEQTGSIGNQDFRVDFKVKEVEVVHFELQSERNHLKTLSPLVVSRRNERGNYDYLQPSDPDYNSLFLNNLLEKYKSTGKPIPVSWQDYPFSLRVVGKDPISKLITIKPNSQQETKVKGYMFDYELIAPQELINLGLLAGFGSENAMGFGFCEIKGS